MLDAGTGLTKVATQDLKKALRQLHRGEMQLPLSMLEVSRCGLTHVAAELNRALRGLDEAGVRAVLVNVLSERLAQDKLAERLAQDKLAGR